VIKGDNYQTMTIDKLAVLYSDYEKTFQLYQRDLDIIKKVQGPQHLDVARIQGNLQYSIIVCENTGKHSHIIKGHLKTKEKVLSSQHPDVALALNNLSLLCYQMEDYKQARALQLRIEELSNNQKQ